MQVREGKAYATLTDVKNLIGDVFAAVDKYGEVVVTSYNKPRYIISVVEDMEPEAAQVAPKAEVSPTVTVPEVVAQPAAAVNEEPITIEANIVIDNDAIEIQPVVEAEKAPEPVAESKPEKIELQQIFTDATQKEMWDRNGPREIAWVDKVRNLT